MVVGRWKNSGHKLHCFDYAPSELVFTSPCRYQAIGINDACPNEEKSSALGEICSLLICEKSILFSEVL